MQPRRIRLASGEVVDPEDAAPVSVRHPPKAPTPRAPQSPVNTSSVVARPQTDQQLLDAILSRPGDLTEHEKRAFIDMRASAAKRPLSWSQQQWATEVAYRLGFDVDHPGNWRETAKEIKRVRR